MKKVKLLAAASVLSLALIGFAWAEKTENIVTDAQNIEGTFHSIKPKRNRLLPVRLPKEEAEPLPVWPNEPEPIPLAVPSEEERVLQALNLQESRVQLAQVLPRPIPLPMPKPQPKPEPKPEPKPKCKTKTVTWCVEFNALGFCVRRESKTETVCE